MISGDLKKVDCKAKIDSPEVLPTLPNVAGLLVDEKNEGGLAFMISNETMLHRIQPTLRENAITGALISVGLERGLDTLVAVDQITEAYLIDYRRQTALTAAFILDIGVAHIKEFGEFKNVEDFISYFTESSLPTTMLKLSSYYSAEEKNLVYEALVTRFQSEFENHKKTPLVVESILRFKHQQEMYQSWISTPQNLNSVIMRRMAGEIHILCGNVCGGQALEQIAKILREKKQVASIVDSSNVDFYFTASDRRAFHETFNINQVENYRNSVPVDRSKTIFVYTRNMSCGPIVPISISEAFPEIYELGVANLWGYFLSKADFLQGILEEDPCGSVVDKFNYMSGGIECRGETYSGVVKDSNSVFLFGDFKISNTGAEIKEWKICEATLSLKPAEIIADKRGAALNPEEEAELLAFVMKQKKLGYDLNAISEACMGQALAQMKEKEGSSIVSAQSASAAYAYAKIATNCIEGRMPNVPALSVLVSWLAKNEHFEVALKIIELIPIDKYLTWKPNLISQKPNVRENLTRENILKDLEEAFKSKSGTPLSSKEITLLEQLILEIHDTNFDPRALAEACITQAKHISRLCTGALMQLPRKFIESKPCQEEAEAVLEYLRIAKLTAVLNVSQKIKIAEIAAALQCAGYPREALKVFS